MWKSVSPVGPLVPWSPAHFFRNWVFRGPNVIESDSLFHIIIENLKVKVFNKPDFTISWDFVIMPDPILQYSETLCSILQDIVIIGSDSLRLSGSQLLTPFSSRF